MSTKCLTNQLLTDTYTYIDVTVISLSTAELKTFTRYVQKQFPYSHKEQRRYTLQNGTKNEPKDSKPNSTHEIKDYTNATDR